MTKLHGEADDVMTGLSTMMVTGACLLVIGAFFGAGLKGKIDQAAEEPPPSTLEACEQSRAAWRGFVKNHPKLNWAGDVPYPLRYEELGP